MKEEKKGRSATFLAGLLTGGVGAYAVVHGLAIAGVSNLVGGIGAIAIGGACLGIAAKTIARNIRTIGKENAEEAVQKSLSKENLKEKMVFKERVKQEPSKELIKQEPSKEVISQEQVR